LVALPGLPGLYPSSASAGTGLSAGQSVGGPAGGGAGGFNLRGIGPVSGGLLASGGLLLGTAGFNQGNPLLGAAGGALAGFAFGGPIGAVVGGIVGFIGGLFGRSRQKKKARRAEREFLAHLKEIEEQFNLRQLAAESAMGAIDSGFEQFSSTVAGFGKPGRRARAVDCWPPSGPAKRSNCCKARATSAPPSSAARGACRSFCTAALPGWAGCRYSTRKSSC